MPGLEGRALGRYELRRLIGRGGMAEVYAGYDIHFERGVAIKVFQRDDEEMLSRFLREARLMASFHNPHLVQVYDTGAEQVGGDNRYYIVMPFMEGGTLRSRIRRSPLQLPETCHNLKDIASALDYIHQQGVIHRDIKSSNVLLDGDDHCYLSDFGIARTNSDVTQLTLTGSVLGTAEYVAPELFEENRRADARSDLYSLGVLLFEMVTGQLPFSAENQIALLTMHVVRRPPAASNVCEGISPAVDSVIFKALEKKPERRYASATELAEAFCSAVAARNRTVVDVATQQTLGDGLRRPVPNKVILPPAHARTPQVAKLRQAPLAAAAETFPPGPSRASPAPLEPLEPLQPSQPRLSRPPAGAPPSPLPRTNRLPVPPRRARPKRARGWVVAVLAACTLLAVIGLSVHAVVTQTGPGNNRPASAPAQAQGGTVAITPDSPPLSPTATSNARATAQAQASATAGALPGATSGSPAYKDALKSAANQATQAARWDGLDGSNSHCSFQTDGYHVTEEVNLVNFYGCHETGKTYQNATLAVVVNVKSGHSAGIFFHLSTGTFNTFSGYLFEVDSRGHYKFSLLIGGITTALRDWSSTSALKSGYDVTNTLQVIMRASTFLLYSNGNYLTQITDATYSTAGEIGFLATTSDTAADIVYSGLNVYARF